MSRRRSPGRVLASFFVAGILAACVAGPASADDAVPYQDPNAVGSIGLCDKDKQPVTSGSVYDQPFVWTAVSSEAAPPGYDNGTALLLAYQPRPGVAPGEWSGNQLNASSTFTNPQHPMTQFTVGDQPLISFIGAYPPQVDGLIQLRIYFGAANTPPFSQTYPAANIRIDGDHWSVVGAADAACDAGSATSKETELLPSSAFKSPKPAKGQGGASRTASPSAAGGGGSGGEVAAPEGTADPGDSGFVAAGLVAVAIIGAAAGLLYWRRSRHPSG